MRSLPDTVASIRPADEIVSVSRPAHTARHDPEAAARLEGFRAGREQGYEAGFVEGQQAASSEAYTMLQTLQNLLIDVHRAQRDSRAAVERLAAELAMELAEHIIGRELAFTQEPGIDAITRALALQVDRERVAVRFHPEVAERIDGDLFPEIEIVADPNLGPTDSIAEIGNGLADVSIDAAVARVREALS